MDNSLSDAAKGSTQGRSPVGAPLWNQGERWLPSNRSSPAPGVPDGGPRARLVTAYRLVDRFLSEPAASPKASWLDEARLAHAALGRAIASVPPSPAGAHLGRPAGAHVDLADVVRFVVADRAGPHRPSLAETRLEPASIVADEVRVRVILRALVGWLERRASPGSRIRASVMHRSGNGVVELLVRGPGPSRAELEAALAGGPSVGDVALARRLCLAEGGRVGTLDRAGPERGFEVSFPAA